MNAFDNRRTVTTIVTTLCVALIVALTFSCGSATGQETKNSTIKGAGIGALLGQAIGNDTESTVIGGVIGAGVGRVSGKHKDKENAAKSAPPVDSTPVPPAEAPKAAEPSEAAEAPKDTEPSDADPATALPGTVWKLESLQPADRVPAFFSKVVTFLPEGYVQTLTTDPEGNVLLSEESYSAVGDTLLVSLPEHTIHARFKLDGDRLIVSADDFSAVLGRLYPER